MKTRKILLRALRRSIPALILIVLCAAVALFADGRYTFSFLQGETILPSFSSPLGDEGDATDPGDILTPGDKDPSVQVVLPGATAPQNALSRQDIARLSEAVRWDIPGAMTLMSEGFWRSQQSYSKTPPSLPWRADSISPPPISPIRWGKERRFATSSPSSSPRP